MNINLVAEPSQSHISHKEKAEKVDGDDNNIELDEMEWLDFLEEDFYVTTTLI